MLHSTEEFGTRVPACNWYITEDMATICKWFLFCQKVANIYGTTCIVVPVGRSEASPRYVSITYGYPPRNWFAVGWGGTLFDSGTTLSAPFSYTMYLSWRYFGITSAFPCIPSDDKRMPICLGTKTICPRGRTRWLVSRWAACTTRRWTAASPTHRSPRWPTSCCTRLFISA